MSKSKCTKHVSFGPLWRIEMSKKWMPLWHEAHFEVKMCKTRQVRSTFGSWDVEKVHAVVARSRFRSQNVKKHLMFGSWDVEKVHVVVARSTFLSQNVKNTTCSDRLWTFRSFYVAGARNCAPCQKLAKRADFVAVPKALAGVGYLKRIWKDALSVASTAQETCSSEMLGGQGAHFLRGVAFCSIRSSGLGRWFCVTGAAFRMTWPHFFVAGAML